MESLGDAGSRERVLTLVFDSLKQRRTAVHGMLLAVASTWPHVLNKSGWFWLNSVLSLLLYGHGERNSSAKLS